MGLGVGVGGERGLWEWCGRWHGKCGDFLARALKVEMGPENKSQLISQFDATDVQWACFLTKFEFVCPLGADKFNVLCITQPMNGA